MSEKDKLTRETTDVKEHKKIIDTLTRPLEYGQVLIIIRWDVTTGDYVTDIGVNPQSIVDKEKIGLFLKRQSELILGQEPKPKIEIDEDFEGWN